MEHPPKSAKGRGTPRFYNSRRKGGRPATPRFNNYRLNAGPSVQAAIYIEFRVWAIQWGRRQVVHMFRCLQSILVLLLAAHFAALGQNTSAPQPQNKPEGQTQNPTPQLQPRPAEPPKSSPASTDRQITLDVQ